MQYEHPPGFGTSQCNWAADPGASLRVSARLETSPGTPRPRQENETIHPPRVWLLVRLSTAHPLHRLPQRLDTSMQHLLFLVGELGLEDMEDAPPSDDARQQHGDPVLWVVTPHGDDRALVTKHHAARLGREVVDEVGFLYWSFRYSSSDRIWALSARLNARRKSWATRASLALARKV